MSRPLNGEFKKFMMQMSSRMLEEQQEEKVAARLVENKHKGESFWVFSESIQRSANGLPLEEGQSPFLWLRRLVNGTNILIEETLAWKVSTPLEKYPSPMPSHSAVHARELHASYSNNCGMLDGCKLSQYSEDVWLLWSSSAYRSSCFLQI